MWLRVFSPVETEPPAAALAERLHAAGVAVVPHFRGDDLGWAVGELHLPGGGTPLMLARYLTREDDLRDDLNAFAAELETMTHSPHAVPLMERVIQTRQLFTVRRPIDHPNESLVEAACNETVRFLATRTGGFYQIDGRGWFDADDVLLVEEF